MIHQAAKTCLRVLLSHSYKNQAIPPFSNLLVTDNTPGFPVSSYENFISFQARLRVPKCSPSKDKKSLTLEIEKIFGHTVDGSEIQ